MKIICVGRKKAAVLFLAACALLAAVVAANAFAPAAYAAFAKKRALPIYSVEREDKTISISFDCAWGVEHTDELLKIMDEQDVKCTFFMVQFWAEKYPEYVQKIAAAGHEIGTHSRTHPKMSELTKEQIVSELKTSCEAIEKITGKKTELFRPPFGITTTCWWKRRRKRGCIRFSGTWIRWTGRIFPGRKSRCGW